MPTFLVIDNTESTKDTLQKYFSPSSNDLTLALSGREGILIAIEQIPDVIICATQLSDMDAFEVLQSLQSHLEINKTIFILLAEKWEEDIFRKGMEYGADDFFTKPLQMESLQKTIQNRLNKQQKIQQLFQQEWRGIQAELDDKSSHEVNTSLTAILLSTELLLRKYPHFSADEIKKFIVQIQDSAQRLHDTLDNHQLFKTFQDLLVNPEIQEYYSKGILENIRPVISDVIHKLGKKYRRENDVDMHLERSILYISEKNLRKIVGEIVENAFEYSQKGQKVWIRGRNKINHYELWVENEGQGMENWQIHEIENSLKQIHQKSTGKNGMGLGLYIAKTLLDINKATLKIESIPNKKTSVKAVFPI